MRIYLAPSAFHPAKGGVEELTLKMAQHLRARGHDVLVLVNRHPADLPHQDVVEGVPVVRLAFPPRGRRPVSVTRYAVSRAVNTGALDALGPVPDVVHVVCPSSQLAPVAGWARRRRVPVVITSQGETEMDANRLYQRSAWMRRVLRREAGRAAALTACSAWTAQKAARVAPAFADAEVILNGVDPEDWIAADVPTAPVVCAWGRHVPQKGLDLLVDAFPLVREHIPEARLLVGGDGPENERLRENASAGVEFLGALDRQGVRSLLERARVAAVPSRVEPFGIVAVEALAAGRGLVYSTNGGLAEAAGGLGFPVDPTNREALAAAVTDALQASVDSDAARRRAAELSWERLTERYLAVYGRVVARQT